MNRMNLAEALAHVDAMTPAEKAAWDQANGFTSERERIQRAEWACEHIDDIVLPAETSEMVIPDVLRNCAAQASNMLMQLDEVAALLRIWPGDPDQNFPSVKEWLEDA